MRFYRRRVVRLAVPIVVWGIFYVGYRHWVYREPMPLRKAAVLVVTGRAYSHLYFLFIIAGLCVLTPPLRFLMRAVSPAAQAAIAAAALAAAAAFDVHEAARGGRALLVMRFLPYTGYYLAAPLMERWRPSKNWFRAASLGYVLSLAATIAAIGLFERRGLNQEGLDVFSRYLSPTIVVMSLGIFAMGRWFALRPPSRRWGAVVRLVAPAALGIYLVHPIFYELVVVHLRGVLYPNALLGVPFWSILIFLASLMTTKLIQAVPALHWLVS